MELTYFFIDNNTDIKIDSFSKLEFGWSYGEGDEIDLDIVCTAKNLHNTALYYGFTETDAFAGLNGEIRITLYKDDYYLEFTINQNQTIDYIKELKGDIIESKESISISKSYEIISIFGREFCKDLSESLISNTMINDLNDSKVLPLRTVTEYPFSIENVLSHIVTEFAPIFQSSTQQLLVTQ